MTRRKTPLAVIGIDPGYYTQGVVRIGRPPGQGYYDCLSATAGQMKASIPVRERCARMLSWISEEVQQTINDGYPLDRIAVAYEVWIPGSGKNPITAHWRAFYDGCVETFFGAVIPPELTFTRWKPGAIKAICHSRGKATDGGKSKDMEYTHALNSLDRLISPATLGKIELPALRHIRTWKSGREHTLDAACAAALAAYSLDVDAETGTLRELVSSDVQLEVVKKYSR